MLLESLAHNDTNIKNITSVAPAPFVNTPFDRLEYLKQTELYNPISEEWSELMPMSSDSTKLEGIDVFIQTATQLLGVFVEAHFDRVYAASIFEKLKCGYLYDQATKEWGPGLPNKRILAQLCGILAEAKFIPDHANKLYEDLKSSRFYLNNTTWCDWVAPPTQAPYWEQSSTTQLVGILIELELGHSAARRLFEALKNSPLYKKEEQRWNARYDSSGKVTASISPIENLLAILIEAQFNPYNAQKLYTEFKASSYYDQEKKFWIKYSDSMGKTLATPHYNSTSELLDILIRIKLHSLAVSNLTLEQVSLPKLRRF